MLCFLLSISIFYSYSGTNIKVFFTQAVIVNPHYTPTLAHNSGKEDNQLLHLQQHQMLLKKLKESPFSSSWSVKHLGPKIADTCI